MSSRSNGQNRLRGQSDRVESLVSVRRAWSPPMGSAVSLGLRVDQRSAYQVTLPMEALPRPTGVGSMLRRIAPRSERFVQSFSKHHAVQDTPGHRCTASMRNALETRGHAIDAGSRSVRPAAPPSRPSRARLSECTTRGGESGLHLSRLHGRLALRSRVVRCRVCDTREQGRERGSRPLTEALAVPTRPPAVHAHCGW